MTYHVQALGGTLFRIRELDIQFDSGKLDEHGQWVETDDLEDAARTAGNLPDDTEIELPF